MNFLGWFLGRIRRRETIEPIETVAYFHPILPEPLPPPTPILTPEETAENTAKLRRAEEQMTLVATRIKELFREKEGLVKGFNAAQSEFAMAHRWRFIRIEAIDEEMVGLGEQSDELRAVMNS